MSVRARAKFETMLEPAKGWPKLPGVFEIEVFKAPGFAWRPRTLPNKGLWAGIEGSPEYVQRMVAERFAKQLTPWEWVDADGQFAPAPNLNKKTTHRILPRTAMDNIAPHAGRAVCGDVVHLWQLAGGTPNCDRCRSKVPA